MKQRGHRKKRTGIVLGDKMEKTIIVKTERLERHPLYGRVVKRWTKFKVHDEGNRAKVGDKVRIVETKPLSKDKRWRLLEILRSEESDTERSETT